jgi:hypothetical protein
MRVPVFLA